MHYQCILFDFDGVIIDSNSTKAEALELVFKNSGYEFFKVLAPRYFEGENPMSYGEYRKLSHGDIRLAKKYPIPPALRADIQNAIRLYIISRVADLSA